MRRQLQSLLLAGGLGGPSMSRLAVTRYRTHSTAWEASGYSGEAGGGGGGGGGVVVVGGDGVGG